jgi:hypothetical protein
MNTVAIPSFASPLLLRSWFDRVWTIQEMALSRKCLVICGTSSMSWERLSRALWWLESWPQFENTSKGRVHDALWHAFKIDKTRKSSAKPSYTLSQLLEDSHAMECSNPLDKILGFYAVFNKYGLEVPSADYSKCLSIVYRETTKAVMEHDNSLLLLRRVHWDGLADEWPSWVPDWSKSDLGGYQFVGANASSDAAADFSFSSDGMHLMITGLIVDIVDQASLRLCASEGQYHGKNGTRLTDSDYRRVVQQWVNMAMTVSCVTDMESWTEALCSTLLVGWGSPILRGQFKAWLECRMTTAAPSERLGEDFAATLCGYEAEDEQQQNPYTRQPHEAFNRVHDTASLDYWLTIMHEKETFFLTGDARMGIASVVARGDLVVLVSGCECPVILRKTENSNEDSPKYRLMGMAYVHGIMSGEAWPNNPGNLQKFCII